MVDTLTAETESHLRFPPPLCRSPTQMKTLSKVLAPGRFVVCEITDVGEASIRLKRLGICENRSVELVQAGDPMIVRVAGARIGLSRRLATSVIVREKDTSESPVAQPVGSP